MLEGLQAGHKIEGIIFKGEWLLGDIDYKQESPESFWGVSQNSVSNVDAKGLTTLIAERIHQEPTSTTHVKNGARPEPLHQYPGASRHVWAVSALGVPPVKVVAEPLSIIHVSHWCE